MFATEHVKSVSFDGNDEFVSAPSFSTTLQTSSRINATQTFEDEANQRSVSPGRLKVYGLCEDSGASAASFVFQEGQLWRVNESQWDTFGRGPFPWGSDDEASEYGSAEWDSDQSVLEDVVDLGHQNSPSSTGALFGDRQWRSITSSQMIKGLMDIVNLQLLRFDLLDDDIETPRDVLPEDGKPAPEIPEQPRDILPEHEKLFLNIASESLLLTPLEVRRKLKHDLHHNPDIRKGAVFKPSKCATLKLYRASNTNFDKLEKSWQAWHNRVQHLQINLISVINTRGNLIEAGKKIIAWSDEATHEHAQWRPKPVPVTSAHGKARYVVDTTYDEKTGRHGLPESMSKFSMAHDKAIISQVEAKNKNWAQFVDEFNKVMLPLRYAQAQFRNLQLKFEYAIAGDIILLQKAIAAHEELEIEWSRAVLGDLADWNSWIRKEYKEQDSDKFSDFTEATGSPVFIPMLSRMPYASHILTSDDVVAIEGVFNPPPSLASGFSFEHSSANNGGNRSSAAEVSSEPRSIHSSPASQHSSPRESMGTSATSVDEASEDLKIETTTVSEPTSLHIHSSQAQKGNLMEVKRRKRVHEVLTEVMAKHEAARVRGPQTSDDSCHDEDSDEEEKLAHETFAEILARHEAERVEREKNYALSATRLHEFGLIDFENIRRIHRNIMSSLASHTDCRCRLGLVVHHIKECQLCWCDAGNRFCYRCELFGELNEKGLLWHFGVGEEPGHWADVNFAAEGGVIGSEIKGNGMEMGDGCDT